jgi:hypothetical protein
LAKHCTICSSGQDVRDKVTELHRMGKSYRDIEVALLPLFKLKVSASSIGRHLKNCLSQKEGEQEENPSTIQSIIEAPKPDGADMHNALCHILFEGIQLFFQRMKETTDKTTAYSVHLETFRGLDILINMLEKLYPNSANLAEAKQKRKESSNLEKLNHLQRHALYKMFQINKTMNPLEFKEFILKEIISVIDEEIKKSPEEMEQQDSMEIKVLKENL